MQQIKISAWGNSLGQAGDILELTPVDEGLLIKKTSGKTYQLADILESFSSSETAPQVDYGEPRGEEIW